MKDPVHRSRRSTSIPSGVLTPCTPAPPSLPRSLEEPLDRRHDGERERERRVCTRVSTPSWTCLSDEGGLCEAPPFIDQEGPREENCKHLVFYVTYAVYVSLLSDEATKSSSVSNSLTRIEIGRRRSSTLSLCECAQGRRCPPSPSVLYKENDTWPCC